MQIPEHVHQRQNYFESLKQPPNRKALRFAEKI